MIPNKEIKQRLLSSTLFKDSFWALSGNVFGKGLALLAAIVIARFLGKDLYGMYGIVRTTLLSIAVFSTFGLGYTATKYIAEYIEKAPNRVHSIIRGIMQITLSTAMIFAFILLFFSKQVAAYLEVPELYNAIRYLSIIIIFNSITTSQTAILAGFKKFKKLAYINLLNGVMVFIFSVVFTYLWSIEGSLIALLISQFILSLHLYIEVSKVKKTILSQTHGIKYGYKKELLSFSFPVAMQEMIYSVQSWIIPILIVKFSNFGEVGLFSAAAQWSSVILFIPGTLRNVILSHISSSAGNLKQQSKLLKQMLLINFLTTLIPCLLISMLSKFIVKSYGESFSNLTEVLNFSVYSTIFSTMSNVFKQFFLAVNKAWFTFNVRLASVIVIFFFFSITMMFFDDNKGALHLVQINLITQLLLFIYLFLTYRKYYNGKR